MNMQEIRAIARSIDLKPGKMTKPVLIRAIQAAEGNYTCFASEQRDSCEQIDCLWREDCLSPAQLAAKAEKSAQRKRGN